ncbi:MAG: hypothetical protein ACI910_001354 [Oleispira sp.]|jgi:hypothetical protein
MSLLKQIRLLFIDFFNRLGQIQSPDGDVTMTCPLRRLPKVAITRATQCPTPQTSNNR